MLQDPFSYGPPGCEVNLLRVDEQGDNRPVLLTVTTGSRVTCATRWAVR